MKDINDYIWDKIPIHVNQIIHWYNINTNYYVFILK